METDEIIQMLPVVHDGGELVYVPAREYRANPALGTYVLMEKQAYPEPVRAKLDLREVR